MPSKRINLRTADLILRSQLDLLRLEAGQRRRVLTMLARLEKELVGRVAGEDLSSYGAARVKQLIEQVKGVIAAEYSGISKDSARAMQAAGSAAAKAASRSIEAGLEVGMGTSLPPATLLAKLPGDALVMGAPSADWWARQSQDASFRFANAVRSGIAAGDTNEAIVARVAGRQGFPGVIETSRQAARSLVHASIQEAANEARMETFRRNDDVVEGVMQLSTLDGNTTDICIAYSGMEWTLDEEPIGDALPFDGGPPRHWGCRSVLVPVTKSFKELGIDAPEAPGGTRASAEGQVPADTTFEQFLSRRTEEEQDEQLGAGRAEMWREGKITLTQLLDQRGNSLTLGQLERRYG